MLPDGEMRSETLSRHQELRHIHEENRGSFPDGLNLRMRRAISWLDHAERTDDHDSRFIFYWIALNATYATEERPDGTKEMKLLEAFLNQIAELDGEGVLHDLMRAEFSNIQELLERKFMFQPYWHNWNWEKILGDENEDVTMRFRQGDATPLLSTVLKRLYTLRNQLVHGGATWNGSLNRDQVKDGARMLASIVPRIVQLMMDNPHTHQQWGRCPYPPQFPPGDRRGSVPTS